MFNGTPILLDQILHPQTSRQALCPSVYKGRLQKICGFRGLDIWVFNHVYPMFEHLPAQPSSGFPFQAAVLAVFLHQLSPLTPPPSPPAPGRVQRPGAGAAGGGAGHLQPVLQRDRALLPQRGVRTARARRGKRGARDTRPLTRSPSSALLPVLPLF